MFFFFKFPDSNVRNDIQINGIGSTDIELKNVEDPSPVQLTISDIDNTTVVSCKVKDFKFDPEKGRDVKADFEEAIELCGYGR